jgi:hypothetical protein
MQRAGLASIVWVTVGVFGVWCKEEFSRRSKLQDDRRTYQSSAVSYCGGLKCCQAFETLLEQPATLLSLGQLMKVL